MTVLKDSLSKLIYIYAALLRLNAKSGSDRPVTFHELVRRNRATQKTH